MQGSVTPKVEDKSFGGYFRSLASSVKRAFAPAPDDSYLTPELAQRPAVPMVSPIVPSAVTSALGARPQNAPQISLSQVHAHSAPSFPTTPQLPVRHTPMMAGTPRQDVSRLTPANVSHGNQHSAGPKNTETMSTAQQLVPTMRQQPTCVVYNFNYGYGGPQTSQQFAPLYQPAAVPQLTFRPIVHRLAGGDSTSRRVREVEEVEDSFGLPADEPPRAKSRLDDAEPVRRLSTAVPVKAPVTFGFGNQKPQVKAPELPVKASSGTKMEVPKDAKATSNSAAETSVPSISPEATKHERGHPTPPSSKRATPVPSPQPSPRTNAPKPILVHAIAPGLNKQIALEVFDVSTVADLITAVLSKEPSLVGCRIASRGRLLSRDDSLAKAGVKDESSVYVAHGEYADPRLLLLTFLRDEYRRIHHEVQKAGGPQAMSATVRGGYYEELMRLLFKTDDLQELQEPHRSERKQFVRDITTLQDELKPGSLA